MRLLPYLNGYGPIEAFCYLYTFDGLVVSILCIHIIGWLCIYNSGLS